MGHPWELPVWVCLVVTGLPLACSPAVATERSTATREDISASLRAHFRFEPKAKPTDSDASKDPDVVVLPAVNVTARKDRSLEIERIFRADRQKAELLRPNLEGGGSVERSWGGRPVSIGARPYRDLLQEDARFKSPKLVTPTWTLLDIKM